MFLFFSNVLFILSSSISLLLCLLFCVGEMCVCVVLVRDGNPRNKRKPRKGKSFFCVFSFFFCAPLCVRVYVCVFGRTNGRKIIRGMREMKFHFISPVTGPKEEGNDNGTQNPAYTASRAYTGKRETQGGKRKPCPMYRGAQKRTRAHGPNKKHQWTSQQLTCPWGFATEEKYLFDVLCGTGWGASGKHNAAPHSRTDTHAQPAPTRLNTHKHTKKGNTGEQVCGPRNLCCHFHSAAALCVVCWTVAVFLDLNLPQNSAQLLGACGTSSFPWRASAPFQAAGSTCLTRSARSCYFYLLACLRCAWEMLACFFGWLNGPGYHFLCLFLAKRRRAPFGIVSLPREEGAASGEMTV